MTDNLDIIERVRSGEPVEFVIGDHRFALRQLSPAERDRLYYIETRARDKALADYRADGLDKEPVSDAMRETMALYMAALEQAYQFALAEDDDETAIQAARDMEEAPSRWPANLAQERANEWVRRTMARWVVDNLLVGERAVFVEATLPDPLTHTAVIDALAEWQKLAMFDPNSPRRSQ